MKDNLKKAIKYSLSTLLAVILVYISFKGNDWGAFLDALAQTNWWYIAASMVVALAALVMRSERWRLQLLGLDPSVGRGPVWHGSNVGNALSILVPGIGEIYRCQHVSTPRASFSRVFGSIIVERFWDVVSIAVLLVACFVGSDEAAYGFMVSHVYGPLKSSLDMSLGGLVAMVLGAVALVLGVIYALRRRVRVFGVISQQIKGLLIGVAAFRKVPVKGLYILYTVGILVAYIFMTYFTFLAIPSLGNLGWHAALFITAVGNIASVIPTPGNMGSYHYLVGLALSAIYLGSDTMDPTALLCATILHGAHAILLLLLGLYSYTVILRKASRRS